MLPPSLISLAPPKALQAPQTADGLLLGFTANECTRDGLDAGDDACVN